MIELEDVVSDVEDFLVNTEDPRFLSERDRDYVNNNQWSEEERCEIESRGQAAITVNRIKPKVEGLKGLLNQRKTDPKAWARTQKHEKAAEAVTDALRFVSDNNDLDQIKLDVADNVFVEGYGAAITQVVEKGNDVEIEVTSIPWDRYYFDNIHSRRLDFTDKRWDGIIIWMGEDQVEDTFGLSDDEIAELYIDNSGNGFETFDDRPQWIDRKEKRIRICQHFKIYDGKWHMMYFTSSRFLIEPMISPYVDEYGEPVNPIEAISANIDRDNNRFGEVRYWIDLQDEINHRRSKYLYLLSSRQTSGRKGSIPDIPAMKRELSKPDGHVEYEGEKGDFDILRTNDMAQAQFTLLQDSKAELDGVGFSPDVNGRSLSGTAVNSLEQAATNELSSLYAGLTGFEKRLYRQFWMRIKQFWKEEKWLRVLDDKTKLRWVGLNQKITLKMMLEESANDESLDIDQRQQVGQQLQQMVQAQDPRLNQVIESRNDVSELDVDIILETSFDTVNVQREQFDLLAKIAQTNTNVPFTEVLKLSELRGKDKIIKSIESTAQANSQQQQQIQQMQEQLAQLKAQSDAQLNQAKTAKEQMNAKKAKADAELTELQTEILIDSPPADASVVL